MQCPVQGRENAEILLAYCARSLDPDSRAVLERHMEVCPSCREFAAQQRLVWEALDKWEAAAVPEDFDRALYARIQRETSSRWWQRALPAGLHLSWRPALPIAMACVTVLAAFLVRTPDLTDARYEAARAEVVDVEQVESTLEDMEMLRQFNVYLPQTDAEGKQSL